MAERRGVVDDDRGARVRERREVRGAQERLPARPDGQHQLLPRVAGSVDEPRAGLQDLVAIGAQRGQAHRELARPPLDPAELGARCGAGVDGDAVTGQRA
jgi:hypothetical protein